jgi:hypothetical protein
MLRVSSVAALVLLASPALADRSDADGCARKLSGLSLQTYNASVGKAENGATLRQAIGSYLGPLVDSGKVEESAGKKAGFQAAMCVRLVHR